MTPAVANSPTRHSVLVPKPYRQIPARRLSPKHASGNGAYTLRAMSLTHLRNSAKLEATD